MQGERPLHERWMSEGTEKEKGLGNKRDGKGSLTRVKERMTWRKEDDG